VSATEKRFVASHHRKAAQAFCDEIGASFADVAGPSRKAEHVAARRRLVQYLRDIRLSYPEIGVLLGRHHASIMYLAKTGQAEALP
jgi:chromosomal replication initiation ATPase DnaA